MGLDMMARTLDKRPATPVDFEVSEDDMSEDLCTWRKHPNLHGWMEGLYRQKGGKDEDFNVVPVLVESADLDILEKLVEADALPHTEGFFFGTSQPEDKADDLRFIALARAAIAEGKFVYYTSWW